jgi:CxxC-x17-CxxC domain-containing protein
MPRDFDGGGRRFDSGPREMHDAVCSECGQACQVPFKPTEGKPVYCRDCFAKKKPRRF